MSQPPAPVDAGSAPSPSSTLTIDGGSTPQAEEQSQLFAVAKAKLDGLLAERTRFYESADLRVQLAGTGADAANGAPTVVVMYRLLTALKAKIDATKVGLLCAFGRNNVFAASQITSLTCVWEMLKIMWGVIE
jgi:hypothetical protein